MSEDKTQWVAVSILVFKGDRVLAMQRASRATAAPGLWEVISGRVRSYEDPLQAALREGAEESGVQFEIDRRPVTAYAAVRGREPMTVVVFRARWCAGEVVLSAEHDDYQWCTVDDFEALGAPAQLVAAAREVVSLGAW